MTQLQEQAFESDLSQTLQHQLKVIAKVAVAISVLAAVVLLGTIYYLLSEQPHQSYYQAMQALTKTQDQLVIAMLLGGALIVSVAGIMTWFITLYTSARIAGPLYRFSQNIELEITQGPVSIIGLRKGDPFQDLSHKLNGTVEGLSRYYEDQHELIDEMHRTLEVGPEQYGKNNEHQHFKRLLQQLKETAI